MNYVNEKFDLGGILFLIYNFCALTLCINTELNLLLEYLQDMVKS